MMRLVSDENFNGDIVRGMLRRRPDLELGQAIDEILFLSIDAEPEEWKDQVLYLPL